MAKSVTISPQDNILGEQERLKTLLNEILHEAKGLGATAAEIGASVETGFTTTVRMGDIDTMEYNRDKGIGVTVYFGNRKGSASTSDSDPTALRETLKAACDIAQYTSEDPCAGLADKNLLAFDYPDLDLYYPWSITPEEGIELAKSCEAKGRAVDPRITNSEGATVSSHQGIYIYANTDGFVGAYPATRHSLSCSFIASEGQEMQRDYSYTVARDPKELRSANDVALEAAKRTLRKLGARRLSTRSAPVIFEAEIARGLLGHFISAIRGGSLYRKSSFLLDHLGKQVYAKHIEISEHPHLKKALGSSPFDGEGVKTQDRIIVRDGILQNYVLDSYSARKLGMQTTGNSGGVHNLQIKNSATDLNALIKEMDTGLLVTDVMGQGVNIITGDYSRGANGFWIEHGEIQYPVEEITIAGNLKDLYLNLVKIANDIDVRGNIRTGSILLEQMVIAGE